MGAFEEELEEEECGETSRNTQAHTVYHQLFSYDARLVKDGPQRSHILYPVVVQHWLLFAFNQPCSLSLSLSLSLK